LGIAIAALLPFNYLNAREEEARLEMQDAASHVELHLKVAMDIPRFREKRRARIEIVPLIDIVFFLLATFVMVSLSMVKHKGIPVVLPSASTGLPQERACGDQHFRYRAALSGQEGSPSQGALHKNPCPPRSQSRLRVLINGDVNARLGLAIEVLDEVRKSGITKVAFETAPKPSR
jgi:biopolymer transport protein ExbD